MSSVLDFANKISPKHHKVSGKEVEIGCPFKECPNFGQPQFYINIETEMWCCKRCDAKGGNLKQLEYKLGILKVQDPKKVDFIFTPDADVAAMHEALLANEEAMSYLMNKRGFSKASIIQHRLGYLPNTSEGKALIYPYFDKEQRCVGWKERYFTKPESSKPKAKFKYKSKQQAYGLEDLDLDQRVIIVEGEGDKIAMWNYGFTNTVSCPQGKMGTSEWTKDIMGAPEYVLFYDNDGNEGVEAVSRKLGRIRCKRAYPRMKDVGEMLSCGMSKEEVQQAIDSSEPMFTPPVSDITSHVEKALEVLEDPAKYGGISTGFPSLDHYLGGLRERELTVVSGSTGNGKTTFGLALMGNLLKKGIKSLIVSPEMPEEDLLLTLVNNQISKKASSTDLLMAVEHIRDTVTVANVYGRWTDANEQQRMMDILMDTLEYSVLHKQVKFVFIDHLHLFITEGDNERKDINELVRRLIRFAFINHVHIFLVVQPRKAASMSVSGKHGEKRKITKSDLKGSSNLESDPHNIFMIHRGEDDSNIVEFCIEKNRKVGRLGTFFLEFDLNSCANYYEIKGAKI